MTQLDRRQFLVFSALNLLMYTANAGTKKQSGLLVDKRFSRHVISAAHPESPDRYKAVIKQLEEHKIVQQLTLLKAKENIEPWLKMVHSDEHIQTIKRIQPETHEHALLATAGLLAAIDAVCTYDIKNAFCASRPPGHHAKNTGQEEGFCYYNHIAIAARYAQQVYQRKKILIVDWDYHHGNGTEWAFYSDPSVLFFSTHDMLAYPGTGFPDRQGEDEGQGFNINVHLPCGATDSDILDAFKTKLIPAADTFSPDLILVSAGFDSREDDLLGCHNITDAGFTELTHIVKTLADRHCDGQIVSLLEGGYNIEGNASAVLAHIKALMA
jgi:acetoin utilization deacetylase AcuC-like enzyme